VIYICMYVCIYIYIYIYITRLASKRNILNKTNKIYREVGRAKDLSEPRVCTDKNNTVCCGWRLYLCSPVHAYMMCIEATFFLLLFKNFSAKYFTPNLETVKFFKSFSSMTALPVRIPQNGGAPKQLRLIPVVLSQFCRFYYILCP
jgi:hypothetical protein